MQLLLLILVVYIQVTKLTTNTSGEKLKFRDYMHDLNKIVIYLEDHKPKNKVKQPEVLCEVLTTSSGSLFQPQIHVPCRQPILARYIYIEAWGLEKRHGRLFSATLCDVEIYGWTDAGICRCYLFWSFTKDVCMCWYQCFVFKL